MNTRKILIPAAILVSVLSFLYLYLGLYHFASVRTDALSAILYPFAIDAVVLVFLIAALDRHVKGSHYAFVWSIVAAGSAVSAVAQYIVHEGEWWERALLAFPALALVALTHLLWVVAQDSIEVRNTEDVLARLTGGAPQGTLEKAIEVLEVAQATGERVTGSKMAQALGLLKDNGSPHYSVGLKWLKKAEEAMDTHV